MKAKTISQLEEEKLSNLMLVSIVGKDLNEMNFNSPHRELEVWENFFY